MNSLEQELLELGGNITTALEDMPLPAALLDRDGIIRWHNRAASAIPTGRVGSEFSEFVASEERAKIRSIIDGVLRDGEPAEFTVQVRNPTGAHVTIHASAVPVRGGGSVVAVFGLGRTADATASPGTVSGTDLTKRQVDVLHLLAEGRSTDEIASHLSLSPTTVRNHVANLIAALGVHSRLQAVVAASKAGLLHQQTKQRDGEPTS
jgi:PAS domain S-box-containing protein